jgi:hypothetical protein
MEINLLIVHSVCSVVRSDTAYLMTVYKHGAELLTMISHLKEAKLSSRHQPYEKSLFYIFILHCTEFKI